MELLSVFSQLVQQQSYSRGAGQTNGVTGAEMVMSMFSGLGTNDSNNVVPEQVYARQLAQLQEMGFPDTRQNVEALLATAGNIVDAIDRLVGNHPG